MYIYHDMQRFNIVNEIIGLLKYVVVRGRVFKRMILLLWPDVICFSQKKQQTCAAVGG